MTVPADWCPPVHCSLVAHTIAASSQVMTQMPGNINGTQI